MKCACPVCGRWHGPDPKGAALTAHRIALLLASPEALAQWRAWRAAALRPR